MRESTVSEYFVVVVGAGRRLDHGLRRGRAIGVDARHYLEHDADLDYDEHVELDFVDAHVAFNRLDDDAGPYQHCRANDDGRSNQHVEFDVEQLRRSLDHYRHDDSQLFIHDD